MISEKIYTKNLSTRFFLFNFHFYFFYKLSSRPSFYLIIYCKNKFMKMFHLKKKKICIKKTHLSCAFFRIFMVTLPMNHGLFKSRFSLFFFYFINSFYILGLQMSYETQRYFKIIFRFFFFSNLHK